MIDLVFINLYPFEKTIQKKGVTLDEAIENIDIGGPTMIRAAAKNYKDVVVVVNPSQYSRIIQELENSKLKIKTEMRQKLALEAFEHTSRYDFIISGYLKQTFGKAPMDSSFDDYESPILEKITSLRYGENPHQEAAFYRVLGEQGLPDMEQLHGKELSYNNILDLDAALNIVLDFELPAAAVIKHNNPCGAAVGDDILEAYKKAYDADPVSAFGSIVSLNRDVDKKTAQELSKSFVEAIIAPGYEDDALIILKKKPSLRIIQIPAFAKGKPKRIYRSVNGGFLIQSSDLVTTEKKDLEVVTKKHPSQKEINDLVFAQTIVKHVKSNAIVLAKDGQTVGIGAGQMSRVEAAELAIKKAAEKARNAVCGSDAFFPFKDTVELMVKAGVTAVVQPGGSKRDEESISFCNDNSLTMVFSKIRHFKH